jgi:hypothetical protein
VPKFVSAHIIACMTRQDVEKLVKRFVEESGHEVRSLRVQCDTVLGRMVCEWEAPDKETLVKWLERCNVRFRGNDEWVMRVQIEAIDGTVVTL